MWQCAVFALCFACCSSVVSARMLLPAFQKATAVGSVQYRYHYRRKVGVSCSLMLQDHVSAVVNPAFLELVHSKNIEKRAQIVSSIIMEQQAESFGVPTYSYLNLNDGSTLKVSLPSTIQVASWASVTEGKESFGTQAGKWLFVAYVAVSIAAGFKEVAKRFQQWQASNNIEDEKT